MRTHEVVVGEFENAFYANIARRDLVNAGINVRIQNSNNGVAFPWKIKFEGVRLLVNYHQLELAEKIIIKKFVNEITLI